jgi:hypothetical protein
MIDELKNPNALYNTMRKFVKFVDFKNGSKGKERVNFMEEGCLAKEEGYKSGVWDDANNKLGWAEWDNSIIGTGEIAMRMKEAITVPENNLVHQIQKDKFKEILGVVAKRHSVEQALFDIYKSDDCKKAFVNATKVFGKNYDLVSFLLFIKDRERFLPVRSSLTERSFTNLGIEYKMAQKVSWENYNGYLKIIDWLKTQLYDYTDSDYVLSLLDVHSFVWIVGERQFIEWYEESPTSATEPKAATAFDLTPAKYNPQLTGRLVAENHYIKNGERNKKIGNAGEKFVFENEQKKVRGDGLGLVPEWKASKEGDGLGYDILSYDEKGSEIYIEVKTTTGKKDTEFYFTASELKKSKEVGNAYRLYRVYEFDIVAETGEFYILEGSLEWLCDNPLIYLACFGK